MHCVLLLQLSQKKALEEVEDQGRNKATAFTAHKTPEVRADTGCGCALKASVVGLNLHTRNGAPRYHRCPQTCLLWSQETAVFPEVLLQKRRRLLVCSNSAIKQIAILSL